MQSVTDRHWQRWALQDPYHGVMGRGYDRATPNQDLVREKFFESGRRHIAGIMEDAGRLGIGPHFESALDFGCGVGRLVRALTDRCSLVVGVDISPEMLRLARCNCPDTNRVRFATSLDDAEVRERRYDLVHTFLVLQHVRPKAGLAIIRKMLDLAAPGALVVIHVLAAEFDRKRRLLNNVRYRVPPLHWAYNLARGNPWNLPISEMNPYPVDRVYALLACTLEPMLVHSREYDRRRWMTIVGRRSRREAAVH